MSRPIQFSDRSEPYYQLATDYKHPFELDGQIWPSVEHYLQASKFEEGHTELRERIRTARTPKKAQLLAESKTGLMREDWSTVCEELVMAALRVKFSDPVLRKQLLNTGSRELVNGSIYTTYWGMGRRNEGKNRLGALLMDLRREIKSQG